MKVIHLSTTDFGGAYKAAERISEAMKMCGTDSEVYVRTKTENDTGCHTLFTNGMQRIVSKAKNVFNLMTSDGEIVSDFFGTDVTKYEVVKSADVIFLHWVNSFVSYGVVEKILRLGKPVVWVMHDMWPFTGGCHVDGYCGKYESDCEGCPLTNKKLFGNPVAEYNFNVKRDVISKYGNIQFVGPSNWIVEQAKRSSIVAKRRISCIPNPLDVRTFAPATDVDEIKDRYGIPKGRKIVLFGAMRAEKVDNKGFSMFEKVLKLLDGKEYAAVVFGNSGDVSNKINDVSVISLGNISDENELASIYSIADAFASASKQESFGYTVCEALACGTPAVTFDIGGYKDQIVHKVNGYRARPFDVEDFVEGIRFCTGHSSISIGATRDRVIEKSGYESVGAQYVKLLS